MHANKKCQKLSNQNHCLNRTLLFRVIAQNPFEEKLKKPIQSEFRSHKTVQERSACVCPEKIVFIPAHLVQKILFWYHEKFGKLSSLFAQSFAGIFNRLVVYVSNHKIGFYLIYLLTEMWMSQAPTVFYLCKRCAPPVCFFAYDELRAHLRVHHHLRDLPMSELCLYESFPGAHLHAPKTMKRNKWATSNVYSLSSQKSGTGQTSAANPFRSRTTAANSQPRNAGLNVDGSKKSDVVCAKTTTNSQPGNAGSNVVGSNQSNVVYSERHTAQNSFPVNFGASSSGQQQLDVESVGDNAELNAVIQAQVSEHIEAAIKERMPMLNVEIKLQVDRAVKDKVPKCVGETLYSIASGYLGPQPDDKNDSNQSLEPYSSPSPRARLREVLRRSALENLATGENQVCLPSVSHLARKCCPNIQTLCFLSDCRPDQYERTRKRNQPSRRRVTSG